MSSSTPQARLILAGSGTICDIGAPFNIEGSGVVVKFTPGSTQGGSYSYSGTMSGFAVFGNGTYVVNYRDDLAVGITATGPGSVKTPAGTWTATDTEKYTLNPLAAGGC